MRVAMWGSPRSGAQETVRCKKVDRGVVLLCAHGAVLEQRFCTFVVECFCSDCGARLRERGI